MDRAEDLAGRDGADGDEEDGGDHGHPGAVEREAGHAAEREARIGKREDGEDREGHAARAVASARRRMNALSRAAGRGATRAENALGCAARKAYQAGMRPRVLACLAALALVASCAPSVVWHKEGADEEDLRSARRNCEREAQGYGYAMERGRSGDDLLGGERRAGSATGSVYRDCMERQGWRRYRDQPR